MHAVAWARSPPISRLFRSLWAPMAFTGRAPCVMASLNGVSRRWCAPVSQHRYVGRVLSVGRRSGEWGGAYVVRLVGMRQWFCAVCVLWVDGQADLLPLVCVTRPCFPFSGHQNHCSFCSNGHDICARLGGQSGTF